MTKPRTAEEMADYLCVRINDVLSLSHDECSRHHCTKIARALHSYATRVLESLDTLDMGDYYSVPLDQFDMLLAREREASSK